ncbi:RNA polymerase II transcription factor B subunit 1 [Acarospora aff. strigata]|nr:RNA polymerase II transcription factor B subunit 1 [Acarospora aff. strigata]
MLKVFTQAPGATAPETHVFSFTSPTAARAEADAIKDALSAAIQAAKSGAATPAAGGGGGGSSAAMAIASALSSTPGSGRDLNTWYDDGRLKSDVELQQSLLKADPALSKTFMESLRTKPESITNSQFTSQFWSTRVHVLRAHAIEKNQTRGAYNVLSTIKPKTVDNAIRLSISKEQIQLIFNQHSLVKRVYDENVPKLSEEAFWSRFFQSRLFKKLKGEKIGESDPTDPILDKYLRYDEDTELNNRILSAHVPHIIDIEGNEENHSQRKGNQPDWTMRPASADKVPIIRTLNTLSEKIMSHVAPADVDPSQPIGMDEETFNELALRDLQGDAEENRIILRIKDQNRFFSDDKENNLSADALLYAKQDPAKVLSSLRRDLKADDTGSNLERAIGVDMDSDSEDEPDAPKHKHVGSKSSLSGATSQILAAIQQRRSQTEDTASSSTSSPSSTSTSGLSSTLFDRLSLTHATTTEFLHHFWLAFLSGDAERAGELAKLVESLNRAMDRIKAVADDAEQERMREVDKVKRQVKDVYERTGRKMKVQLESVGGGKRVVDQMLGPTVRAIGVAMEGYRKALARDGLEAGPA